MSSEVTPIKEMRFPNGEVYALPADEDNTERKIRYEADWYQRNEGGIPLWLKHKIETTLSK